MVGSLGKEGKAKAFLPNSASNLVVEVENTQLFLAKYILAVIKGLSFLILEHLR